MQPYRVPLDALMEIDDRRVALMGWLFYTDGRVQTYADEKAEIARLCTSHGDTRKTELVKACKVGSTWYAAARVTNLDGTRCRRRDLCDRCGWLHHVRGCLPHPIR